MSSRNFPRVWHAVLRMDNVASACQALRAQALLAQQWDPHDEDHLASRMHPPLRLNLRYPSPSGRRSQNRFLFEKPWFVPQPMTVAWLFDFGCVLCYNIY